MSVKDTVKALDVLESINISDSSVFSIKLNADYFTISVSVVFSEALLKMGITDSYAQLDFIFRDIDHLSFNFKKSVFPKTVSFGEDSDAVDLADFSDSGLHVQRSWLPSGVDNISQGIHSAQIQLSYGSIDIAFSILEVENTTSQ